MTILDRIRKGEDGILVVGNHPGIVQSILDFDYLSGKSRPSIVALISGTRKAQKFFFGSGEVLLPCFKDIRSVPAQIAPRVKWLLNMQSGRRVFESTVAFFDTFPDALGGHLFAENMPEIHATELLKRYGKKYVIAGPSGVGLLLAGYLKLGAIGGVGIAQLSQGKLTESGAIAVVATSGGMTNELITAVALAGRRVSFSLCIGGDRFPVTSLSDVLALAENDTETKAVVYFGELGGSDEYEIVEMLKTKKLTKPVVCYIAGVIDEAFDEHMQFGHAKALVARKDESARAKRAALAGAGAVAPETFPGFLAALLQLPESQVRDTVADTDSLTDAAQREKSESSAFGLPSKQVDKNIQILMNRQKSILSTREIVDLDSVPQFVKDGTLVKQKDHALAGAILQALLGRKTDVLTSAFVENIFELLIDHGGLVSGAVNTMITARAGKDMVSSLAAGLLTVGPRFGGAVNEAARAWHDGVTSKADAAEFVETNTRGGKLLLGIGHRKYRVGIPDPRVAALSEFAALLESHPHYDFAREVEKVTTTKNGNLILNVDGVMAALLLDMLSQKERMSDAEIKELIEAEFFNALFIIPRSVGFIAHFIEQKRNDEGLFRLPEELLFERKKDD